MPNEIIITFKSIILHKTFFQTMGSLLLYNYLKDLIKFSLI